MNDYTESVVLLSHYLHLFPCYGIVDRRCECGAEQDPSPGKHPRFNSYVDLATQDENQIREWLQTWPNTNFAAHCEKSGVFVLDTDPRSGGHASRARLDDLTEGAIPRTVKAITGRYSDRTHVHRGSHEYFKLPKGLKLPANLSKLGLPGLDIKANGYVIVPPSRHLSGVSYEWAEGLAPQDIEIAEAPEELLNVILPKRPKSSLASLARPSTADSIQKSASGESDSAMNDIAAEWAMAQKNLTPVTKYGFAAISGICDDVYNAAEGERNITLNRAAFRAGYLIRLGDISFPEASQYLRIAASRSRNPLSEEEIAGILAPDGRGFESGYRRAAEELQQKSEQSIGETRSIRDRLNLLNWADLFAEREEQDLWLVKGLIAKSRGQVVYSKPGVGKSILCRELAVNLAAGRSSFGLPARDPIRVLYLDNENVPTGDVLRTLRKMGITPDMLENVFFASFPDIPNLNTREGAQVLEEILDDIQPELVILDTASRFVEGDENSNDTWNALYNHAGKILKARGIAYIRIDHEGKTAAKGQRGGSAKQGDVDLVWHMEQPDEDKEVFTLTNEKARLPLVHPVFTLDRLENPLRHELRDPKKIDWIAAIKTVKRYDERLRKRRLTLETFRDWLYEQPKGFSTGRDTALREFNLYVVEKKLSCSPITKDDADKLRAKLRDQSVDEIVGEEFPLYEADWIDEAA